MTDADPGGGQGLLEALDQGDEIELLGVARNRQTAIQQAETSQPDVVVIDLILTGYRIILAMQAGSLSYITRDAQHSGTRCAGVHCTTDNRVRPG